MNRQTALWLFLVVVLTMFQRGWAQRSGGDVPEITPQQLRQWQQDTQVIEQLIVVDVRSQEEYEVSIIPGAILVEQLPDDPSQLQDKLIVAYCTSGYRSGKFVDGLRQHGLNAHNLQGSILAWCQAQLPLIQLDGQPTNRVHTYSARNRVPDTYQAVH